MLSPKKVTHRKVFKGRRTGAAHRGSSIAFGQYALKAVGNGWMSARQIEAARVAINHYMKRAGKVWIRIFPDKPITKTPAETRMGKGKGAPEFYVAPVNPGQVLFEVGGGVSREVAKEALRLGKHKLPVKTKFVVRPTYRDSDEA